jgi:glutamate carboxypeptidase
MTLSPLERRLVDAVPPLDRLIEELGALVAINSLTSNKLGVDAVVDRLERRLEGLGFRTSCLVDGRTGRHLVARRLAGEGPRALLIGHTDTVHAEASGFSELKTDEADPTLARGPGAADMKGGLVVMTAALEALFATGRLDGRSVTIVVNADEETGSPTSSDLFRSEAEDARLALGFECGREAEGDATTIVTARRGVGRISLHAQGAAAHAGVDPGGGASAVLECAQKVAPLHALSDPAAGRHVTVGVLRGGTAGNVVPAACEMEVDYRFPDRESGSDLSDRIIEILSEDLVTTPSGRPRVRTIVDRHDVRPPLVRTDAVAAAAARVIEAGAALGLKIVEEARGGSSDAALAADVGCPALCGMGVVGGAIHTDKEWIRLPSLRSRAALAALTLERFFEATRDA